MLPSRAYVRVPLIVVPAFARFYLIVPALSIVPRCELAEKSPVRGETTETVVFAQINNGFSCDTPKM